ncbi:FAA hydrolase family protein [Citricoccus sp. SGAir0253]|uniref:fumarylacetoacetate hydrolase family protein n=1 Tax=Citricoccus sp. SGAir0253 TaxID=2567881 RepID=UPI0010CCE9C1|nr:fumarylacetoacetate hydrolase family protein [Citricoccus sp. SGAir0253]QCU78797.1 FAA hydrolase family protein [Citricoccus sp. SGAir0253]
MKLATFRLPGSDPETPGATFAAIVTADDGSRATSAVELEGVIDVGDFLSLPAQDRTELVESTLTAAEEDPTRVLDATQLEPATVVPFPTKVFCIGLNYRNHILETGLELPEYPAIFTKFAQTLTGATDPIEVPAEDHRLDWEGELCIVIGEPGRRIPEDEAAAHIAGYAVSNDVSVRGYQGRTTEWTQGKIWEETTPVGPWLVTPDEFAEGARITTRVNGEVMQEDSTADLVFGPEKLVSYISDMVTLLPGDLILTGTPAGVALARKDENGRRPWLRAGDVLETSIEGLGAQRNEIR